MISTIPESSISDQIVYVQDSDHDDDYDPYELQDSEEEEEALNKQEMRKIFREQHPWSVSDPFPQSFIPEVFPREYRSTPLLKAEIQGKNRGVSSNHNGFLVTNQTLMSVVLGNKGFLKWVIIVLNVVIELCQATVTQEASQGKIKREIYLKLSIIASSVCLMMSIVEIYHEGKSKGVICLRKNGYCCWFYYTGQQQGQVFGSFALYFGLLSSTIQLIISVAQNVTKRNVIKFDYFPLLLAVCYLAAAVIGSRGQSSRAIVMCKIHGSNAVEGVLIDGHDSLVFECPDCHSET